MPLYQQNPSTGLEQLQTNQNGTFLENGTELYFSANGLGAAAITPCLATASLNVWSPVGDPSTITVTPGAAGIDDYFVCSKNIKTLRWYQTMQVSVASTSRWRTRIYLNGIASGNGQYYGASSNGVGNNRVFGVLEHGGIPAGTQIFFRVEKNTLPASVQNNSSYCVIEYEND
jgi:hypothetical protein